MRPILTALSLVLAMHSGATAQSSLTIQQMDEQSLSQALSSIIFGGCVEISNIAYHGSPLAFGVMTDPNGTYGIGQGLVLSTGEAGQIANTASFFASSSLGQPGLSLLAAQAGVNSFDAAVIEFDFTPLADTLFAGDFIFGSEEYPSFVCTNYNDMFGFFVSGGPGAVEPTNVALIPGTSTIVSINTVNDQSCGDPTYYLSNADGQDIAFGGITQLINMQYPVVPGETYHFMIAISDGGDGIYDSGVIVRSQSFCGNTWFQVPDFDVNETEPLTYQFMNHSTQAESYLWDFGDGQFSVEENPTHTYIEPGDYQVSLTCTNMCFDTTRTVLLQSLVTGSSDLASDLIFDVRHFSDGQIAIDFQGNIPKATTIEVLDALGRKVHEFSLGKVSRWNGTVDVSALPKGAYIARLTSGNRQAVVRFLR